MSSIPETFTANNPTASKIRTFKDDNGKTGKFTRIHNALLKGVLTPYELAVYCVLARYTDEDTQKCYPHQSTIADEARMSEKQVRRALGRLLELKLISIAQERQKNGHLMNGYTLLAVGGSSPLPPVCESAGHRSVSPPAPVCQSAGHWSVSPLPPVCESARTRLIEQDSLEQDSLTRSLASRENKLAHSDLPSPKNGEDRSSFAPPVAPRHAGGKRAASKQRDLPKCFEWQLFDQMMDHLGYARFKGVTYHSEAELLAAYPGLRPRHPDTLLRTAQQAQEAFL